MSIATTNAIKRSAIPDHLINNTVGGKKYNESNFSYFDVIKLEAILI